MNDSTLSPLIRLQASRERLRDAMAPPAPRRPAVGAARRRAPGSFGSFLYSLRRLPVIGEAAGVLAAWWGEHPFRPVARIAGDVSTLAVGPVVRRHPLAMAGTSAAVGAALVRFGPWRWLLRTVLFAGLVPRLASAIVAKLPLQSWLAMLGTMAAGGAGGGELGRAPTTPSTSSGPLSAAGRVETEAPPPASTAPADAIATHGRAP